MAAEENSSLGIILRTLPDREPVFNFPWEPGDEPLVVRSEASMNDLKRRQLTPTATRIAMCGLITLVAGCATKPPPAPATPANAGAPVTEYEMEPIKIEAVKGEGGIHIESFDAAELFERGGAALSEKRYDDAIAAYDRLLKEFVDSRYTKAALYNVGLAYQGKKDWPAAIARFKVLSDQYGDTSDAKDAQFQLGASYAELENWPTSAEVFALILQRKDLNADDKIEALGRRGFAQFKLKDLDTAERTFKSALLYFEQIQLQERLQTDFYLGLCKYHLGEIPHERFRAAPLRLPEKQMRADMEDKARLLLFAQRMYTDTIKLGNPQWASASGYQVASLYEEFYDAFIHAPMPPELLGAGNDEKREVYFDELRKKIRVLLEKSLRWNEQNLLMMERLGVQNEWRDKSKLAFAKLQRLLDPSAPVDAPADHAAGAPAAAAPPPPLPQPPIPHPGVMPDPAPASPDQPAGDRRATEPKPNPPAQGPVRQIL
jgi:tetratricopeptide (TPR) repeat protein